ncbi:hypothetical protein RJ640_007290, partial [Escallonia rubra]
ANKMEDSQPGFRFYPTEEELICFYLRNKLEGKREDMNLVIPVFNIYQCEPCNLPNFAGQRCLGDREQWFFFVPREEREARGGRPNRTTGSGYWKATGSPSYVYSSSNRVIGVKKTMVFYSGKAPTGRKTKWKMNEYRAIEEEVINPSNHTVPKLRHEFSVCRVYVISGSFRAFDRRPLGTAMKENLAQQLTSANDATTTEEASLAGSSYSEENHVDLMQDVENINLDVANGSEPIWDWGQLGWI